MGAAQLREREEQLNKLTAESTQTIQSQRSAASAFTWAGSTASPFISTPVIPIYAYICPFLSGRIHRRQRANQRPC